MSDAVMQFVWFCASGDSFFLGAGITGLAAALSFVGTRPIVLRPLLVVGLLFILLAAIPLSPFFHLALVLGGILLFAVPHAHGRYAMIHRAGQAAVLIACIAGVTLELRFHMAVGHPRASTLWVIGDSVSAGIQGPNEVTWPKLLAAKYHIEVVNLAEPGATAASAVRQVERIGGDAQLVLLEIGGNDLFAPTPPKQFRANLRRLLQEVARQDRAVILLELPVFPWQLRYARIQRHEAKSFGITVVPKRFFVGVLRRPGSSLDLAHLSSLGHERMADQVARLLGLPNVSDQRQ